MTECDEIIIIMYIVSTKEANTIATKITNITAANVMSTDSINCHSKKVKDCYILISDHITIDNYYYLLLLCKTIRYNIKWKIMNFSKVRIKIRTCYYFDDLIKLEDFRLDNVLIDENSYENIFIYDISYKTFAN